MTTIRKNQTTLPPSNKHPKSSEQAAEEHLQNAALHPQRALSLPTKGKQPQLLNHPHTTNHNTDTSPNTQIPTLVTLQFPNHQRGPHRPPTIPHPTTLQTNYNPKNNHNNIPPHQDSRDAKYPYLALYNSQKETNTGTLTHIPQRTPRWYHPTLHGTRPTLTESEVTSHQEQQHHPYLSLRKDTTGSTNNTTHIIHHPTSHRTSSNSCKEITREPTSVTHKVTSPK